MLKAVRSVTPSLLFLRELTSSTTPPRSLPFEMVLLLELYTPDELQIWFKRVRDHQRVSHFVLPSLLPECPRFIIDLCNCYAAKLKAGGVGSSREGSGAYTSQQRQIEKEGDDFSSKRSDKKPLSQERTNLKACAF